MPRASMGAGSFRDSGSGDRFEGLHLDTGEEARIWIPDQDLAWREYAHTLRVPVLGEDGQPMKESKTVRGVPRMVIATRFLGRPICRGDEDVIKSRGLDTDNCPACAMVKRMTDDGITEAADMSPELRLAVPVVQYATAKKSDGSKLRNPPNATIVVWAMSAWTYKKLDGTRATMAELLSTPDREVDAEQVKLQFCDVIIHCESEKWQKYDAIKAGRCMWRHNSDAGRLVKEVVGGLWGNPENRPTDEQLLAACGRVSDIKWFTMDLEDAEWQWRKIYGGGDAPASGTAGGDSLGGPAPDLSGSLDDLDAMFGDPEPAAAPVADPLAGHPGGIAEFAPADQQSAVAAAEAAAPPVPSAPLDDDPFADLSAPAAAAPASAPAAPTPAPAGPALVAPPQVAAPPPANRSFGDIFDGLEEL